MGTGICLLANLMIGVSTGRADSQEDRLALARQWLQNAESTARLIEHDYQRAEILYAIAMARLKAQDIEGAKATTALIGGTVVQVGSHTLRSRTPSMPGKPPIGCMEQSLLWGAPRYTWLQVTNGGLRASEVR